MIYTDRPITSLDAIESCVVYAGWVRADGQGPPAPGYRGPASLMTFDILVGWKEGGQSLYQGVTFSNPVPDEYDVIGGPFGADVGLSMSPLGEVRFWIPWLPVVTDCEGSPAPLRGPMPRDPFMPTNVTEMQTNGGGGSGSGQQPNRPVIGEA